MIVLIRWDGVRSAVYFMVLAFGTRDMQLSGIHRLQLTVNALLVTGLLGVFGAVAGGVVLESETLFGVLFTLGWIAVGVGLVLSFAVDRVRCPNCGRPFTRPDCRNSLCATLRRLKRTGPAFTVTMDGRYRTPRGNQSRRRTMTVMQYRGKWRKLRWQNRTSHGRRPCVRLELESLWSRPRYRRRSRNIAMNWFKRKLTPSRPPQTFTPARIDFVGEQSGPVEDEIKARFREILVATPAVQSAYLARLSYGESPGYSVAVCIRSSVGVDERLEKRLAQIFIEMFRRDERLDTLFMREDQEAELRKVCRAFYERG